MGSVSSGYDLSVGTYSPDGKIFQIEYAYKAVENSSLIIGIKCVDGIVFATKHVVQSKLLLKKSLNRINICSESTAMLFTGYYSDGKHLINRGLDEALNYKQLYSTNIPTKILCKQLGLYVQAHTLYSSVRPFGAVFIIGGHDELSDYSLYMIEPNGAYKGYKACCFGEEQKLAKNELEKIDFRTITTAEATQMAIKILIKSINESTNSSNKDKEYEIEVGVISEDSKRNYKKVPKEYINETIAKVKEELEREEDEEME